MPAHLPDEIGGFDIVADVLNALFSNELPTKCIETTNFIRQMCRHLKLSFCGALNGTRTKQTLSAPAVESTTVTPSASGNRSTWLSSTSQLHYPVPFGIISFQLHDDADDACLQRISYTNWGMWRSQYSELVCLMTGDEFILVIGPTNDRRDSQLMKQKRRSILNLFCPVFLSGLGLTTQEKGEYLDKSSNGRQLSEKDRTITNSSSD